MRQQISRLRILLHLAILEHQHAVSQRQRFRLIVSHIKRGQAEPPLERLNLPAHMQSELSVKIRKRLIQQQESGLSHQRPSHRHALPLPAGELARPSRQKLGNSQKLRRRLHLLLDFCCRLASYPQRKRDVLKDTQVRIKSIRLKDERHIALARLDFCDVAAA